jgi:hypothetical protein
MSASDRMFRSSKPGKVTHIARATQHTNTATINRTRRSDPAAALADYEREVLVARLIGWLCAWPPNRCHARVCAGSIALFTVTRVTYILI